MKIIIADTKLRPIQFTKEHLSPSKNDERHLDDWSFDILKIKDWTDKSRLVWAILKETDLMREFNIDAQVLCNFVSEVRDGYDANKNPYHNYSHGVSGKNQSSLRLS